MNTKSLSKVFIDGYLLNKEPQGTRTYITELYKEVALMNPKTTFYFGCFKDDSMEKEFSNYSNIDFIYYKKRSRIFRMIFEIPKLITYYKFDFAHFQYVIPFVRTKKCKYIVTIHDILFNNFSIYFSKSYRLKRNYLFKMSALKSDYLLTVSDYSKQAIQKRYKLKKKVEITPNGVNESFFSPYNKSAIRQKIKNTYGFDKFILYVSRIEPRKNQELLLKSYLESEIYKTNTHLVFIGAESIENRNFQQLRSKLNTKQKKKIHYYSKLSQDELVNFYKAAKLFVYPSLAEGFGIPPLEAGALKIPVLCANTTALKSYDFFKPYFCNPNNELEFIKTFNDFINDFESIDLDRIQVEIKKKYSWRDSAKILTSVLNNNFESTEA